MPPQCSTLVIVITTTSITPALLQVHWFPVNFRVKFKVVVLMFLVQYGNCPSNFSQVVTSLFCQQFHASVSAHSGTDLFIPQFVWHVSDSQNVHICCWTHAVEHCSYITAAPITQSLNRYVNLQLISFDYSLRFLAIDFMGCFSISKWRNLIFIIVILKFDAINS